MVLTVRVPIATGFGSVEMSCSVVASIADCMELDCEQSIAFTFIQVLCRLSKSKISTGLYFCRVS